MGSPATRSGNRISKPGTLGCPKDALLHRSRSGKTPRRQDAKTPRRKDAKHRLGCPVFCPVIIAIRISPERLGSPTRRQRCSNLNRSAPAGFGGADLLGGNISVIRPSPRPNPSGFGVGRPGWYGSVCARRKSGRAAPFVPVPPRNDCDPLGQNVGDKRECLSECLCLLL